MDVRISAKAASRTPPHSSRRKAVLKKLSSQFIPSLDRHSSRGNLSTRSGESESERDKKSSFVEEKKATPLVTSKDRTQKTRKNLFIESRAVVPAGLATAKSQFVLLFGDHTYQQYGLCMRLPMKFVDPTAQVVLYTSYVVCLMSKFPFFNYLFELLDEFDLIAQGFKFSKPLAVQEIDFILQRELKLLNDFAGRLKKTTAPIYPFLLVHREAAKSNIDASNNGVTDLENSPNANTTSSQQRFVNEKTFAILSDIDFTLSEKKQKKIEVPFYRSTYQTYFSSYLVSASGDSKKNEVINLVKNLQKKQSENFSLTLNSNHKMEKEREDIFLTLLWALPVLLKHLPLDQIVLALGCAVTEMKIIVKHRDSHVISTIILALTNLLHPLRWCSPTIVMLPDSLLDFLGRKNWYHISHSMYFGKI